MKKSMLAFAAVAAISAFAGWSPAPVTIKTQWGEKVTPENALREYPRPQFVRDFGWQCLNGLWDYAIVKDTVESDLDILAGDGTGPKKADGKILVPFPVESSLSGVGRLLAPNEFLWYTRKFNVSPKKGFRTILRFEAVDFRAQVFVNGIEVTDVPHDGMSDPFSFDITDVAKAGENLLQVCVWDPTQDYIGSTGKQCFNPGGCFYMRMSGIWQTVWTETVPDEYIVDYRVNTDIDEGTVRFDIETSTRKFAPAKIEILFGGKTIAKGKGGETIRLPKPIKLWSPDAPNLYDVKFTWGKDKVDSYFAMRKIEMKKDVNGVQRFYLNGKAVFMQGTLDQGWWPESLLTPPSEEAMKADIKFLKDAGFNMMRKHIKVEPRRYYTLCDKMGILVIQDMPSGVGHVVHRYAFHRLELKRMMDHLMNVPSIIMWVPYNEGWSQPCAKNTMDTLAWVKRYDPTRLVDGPSGWHDFEDGRIRDHKTFVAHARDMHIYPGPGMHPLCDGRASFLGEFGGIGYVVRDHVWNKDVKGWGYATDDNLERSFARYTEIMKNLAFLARKGLAGSVYTQTTDVELEINGLLTYDRKVCKYPVAELKKLHDAVYAAADEAANVVRRDVTVVAAKDASPEAWSYTFDTPMGDWVLPAFNDSSWKKSAAGFGHRNIVNEIKGTMLSTVWETPNIYMRKTFDFNGDPSKVKLAWAEVFHDDNCDLYLNGYPILVKEGHTGGYVDAALNMKAFKKALKKGRNVLAAHCRQFGGGQYFDVGIKASVSE